MFHVRLTDHGAATTGNVRVQAWPSPERLAKLPKNGKVELLDLGTYPVGADGVADIPLVPRQVDAAHRGARGTVDVMLTMETPKTSTEYNITLDQESSDSYRPAGGAYRTQENASHNYLSISLDTATGSTMIQGLATDGTPSGTSSVRNEKLSPRTIEAALGAVSTGRSLANATPTEVCVYYASDVWSYGRPQYWAPVYAWSGAKGVAKVTASSQHTLGIGYTGGGGWSQSGTSTITTGGGASTAPLVDRWAANKVNYRDFWNTCGPEQRRPINFYAFLPADLQSVASHVYYGGGCATYLPGQTITKWQGTAITYGSAVNIGPISVSSQSGWNANSEIVWTVTARTKYCGDTAAGPEGSPRIDVRAG